VLIHFAAAWFGPDLHNVDASDQDESSLKPQSGIRMSPVESKDAVSLPKPSHVAATFLEAAELLDQAMAKGRTQTLVFDQQKAITEGLVSLLQHTPPNPAKFNYVSDCASYGRLLRLLVQYPAIAETSFESLEGPYITMFLCDVSNCCSKYLLEGGSYGGFSNSEIAGLEAAKQVLENGMEVLGLSIPVTSIGDGDARFLPHA